MSFNIEALSNETLLFGEGPLWDHRRQKLVVADIFGKSLGLFDPKTKELSLKAVPLGYEIKYLNVAIPCDNFGDSVVINPNFILATGGRLIKFNWETEECNVLFDFKSEKDGKRSRHIFNDGKCDANGKVWIGSMGLKDTVKVEIEPKIGEIHRFESEGGKIEEKVVGGGLDLANGLGWNKENTNFYMVDFGQKVVNVYDFNLHSGTIENQRIFFDFSKNTEVVGEPDGLTIDASGNVWVACWKGGSVIKIDGNTGKLLETVKIPVSNSTSACFGGENFESLFVTTTKIEINQEVLGQPDSGKIFRITSPKDNSFKGFQQYFAKI